MKNRLPGFYVQYNQPLCQKISARSVKNCMTSMQLCSDHPCCLLACWVDAGVPLFLLFPSVGPICENPEGPLFSLFPSVCMFVCLYVCLFVCNGQLWRPEESTNFDETWQVGSYQDLVLCFWAPLLWTAPLPSNGTLKFWKNHKKLFFRKSRICFQAFMHTIINLFVKKFQPDLSKTVWLVCNYVTTTMSPAGLLGGR